VKDAGYWEQRGFVFEKRFPDEYDLWVNPDTMQRLRRYFDGGEWLTHPRTGEYGRVEDTPVAGASGSAGECGHRDGAKSR